MTRRRSLTHWLNRHSRLVSFYTLTRYAHPRKNRVQALVFAAVILRRVKRREKQEGKLPIRFVP